MTPLEEMISSPTDAIYRQILEDSPFGVLRIDADLRVLFASRGARQTLSTIDPLVGSDFGAVLRSVWPEPFASDAISRFRHTLATGEPFRSRATIERRKDRRLVESYDWALQRIETSGGRHEVVCHFYDLTERHHREAELRSADRRKDEWIATLAHELRNPLAPIRVAAARLMDSLARQPDVRHYAKVIDRQAAQMSALLDDLLDVTRLSRRGFVLQRSVVPLHTVIDTAIETSRPAIETAGQTLVADIDPSCQVDGDASRLTQVFVNLLNNAAKYGGPQGCITVSVARRGCEAVVAVRDTGMGIPPDMLERIFDLFEQANDARTRAKGGLGIGLALARLVVTHHNGTITASSRGAGQGSEFLVRLPLCETATTEAPQA